MRPTWQTDDGRIQLYRGDALKVLASLPEGCADFVLLDPPYGTTDLEWDTRPDLAEMWAATRRAGRDNHVTAAFACQPFATDLINSNRRRFRYELIWTKSNACGFLDCNRRPLRAHENILIFVDRLRSSTYRPQFTPGRPYVNDNGGGGYHYKSRRNVRTVNNGRRHPRSVLDVKSTRRRGARGHTRKPADLVAWLIRSYCRPGALVLDPFLGSGSTVEAAIATGRRVIGIELDRNRFAEARNTIKAAIKGTKPLVVAA